MSGASTHASLMATLLCGLSINLELHFLGHRTFPTIEERYKYEMLCTIELLVVGQAGLVFIQFVVGVIVENTCSPENQTLEEAPTATCTKKEKGLSAKSKRRYRQALSLVALESKKKISMDEDRESEPLNRPTMVREFKTEMKSKEDKLQQPTKSKLLMQSQDIVEPTEER